MSKGYRRYGKKKRKKRRNTAAPRSDSKNLHHILWIRRKWDKNMWSRKLRNHPYMKVVIPQHTLHREIHETIRDIPLPSELVCQGAYEEIDRLYQLGAIKDNDSIVKRLNLLIFILEYAADDTVAALKKQLSVASRNENKGGH